MYEMEGVICCQSFHKNKKKASMFKYDENPEMIIK